MYRILKQLYSALLKLSSQEKEIILKTTWDKFILKSRYLKIIYQYINIFSGKKTLLFFIFSG